jgi:hypothetical protein
MRNWQYLFEIHSPSIQEEMAMKNLEANTSSWHNWMTAVALTGNRRKAIKVTLSTPVEVMTLRDLAQFVVVRTFIVTKFFNNPSGGPQLDFVIVDKQGKLSRIDTTSLHVSTVHKAHVAHLEVVDKPKVKKVVKKKLGLKDYIKLLNDDNENMIHWHEAFILASRANKEILIHNLNPVGFPYAVKDVHHNKRSLKLEGRDPEEKDEQWWNRIEVKGFNDHRPRLRIDVMRKNWFKQKHTTWKNDTVVKLLRRNPHLKGTDHFFRSMRYAGSGLFERLYWVNNGWVMSIQAGAGRYSKPRRDNLLVDEYLEWEVNIIKFDVNTGRRVRPFSILRGDGMSKWEKDKMPHRHRFSSDNTAGYMDTEHVDDIFQWLMKLNGYPVRKKPW